MQDGGTPLHYAAGNGHVDVAKVLLSEGAAVDAVDKVIILNTLSCWQCESAFGWTVCPVYHKRRTCGAAGKHEYGLWWLVGMKERCSIRPTLVVDLAQVGQSAVHKQSEMSNWVERACRKTLKRAKDRACAQHGTGNVGKRERH